MNNYDFTVGELADAVTGGNQRAMRKMLNDVGGNYDEYVDNRSEPVGRDLVVGLYAEHPNTRTGRILARQLARVTYTKGHAE